MKLHHITTFVVMGVSMFLAAVYGLGGNYHIAAAYLTAACSWIIVACYEYNERVFNRAVAQLVQKYTADKDNET